PQALSTRGVLLDARLLHALPPSVRGGDEQAHSCGASRSQVPDPVIGLGGATAPPQRPGDVGTSSHRPECRGSGGGSDAQVEDGDPAPAGSPIPPPPRPPQDRPPF